MDLQAPLVGNQAFFLLPSTPNDVRTKLLTIAGVDVQDYDQVGIVLEQDLGGAAAATSFAPTFSEMPLNAPYYTLSNAATADSLLLTNLTPDVDGNYSATVNVWLCRTLVTASTTTSGGATTAALLLIFGSGSLGMAGFVVQRKCVA